MKLCILILLLYSWKECYGQLVDKTNPRVRVAQGIVSGTWKKSQDERDFASFEGIPYARPPVGKFRFREPQRPKPWPGVWEAKEPSSKCLQSDPFSPDEGSEDCLYLNVYTPKPNGVANLPVVVYIHGGAFMFGTGRDFGPKFLMDRDVVYVTLNYRLNVFGFLSTEDDIVSGNMGLKDQSFALHWIKNNIMMFGGDSNSITLIGLSAGGASVHYHYLSSLSRGTFNRGISFSGTALNPWVLTRSPLPRAKAIASHLGCPTTTNREMIDCLRYRPGKALLSATRIFHAWKVNMFSPFTPVVENAMSPEPFLVQLPFDLIRSGRAQQLPWITTVTSQEGLYPAAAYSSDELLDDLEKNWEHLASYIFVYNETLPLAQHPMAASRIKQFYLQGKPVSRETFPQLVQAVGDRHFVVGGEKAARIHALTSNQPIYFYRFSFRGPGSWSDAMSGTTNNYGVSHGDDTFYITNTTYLDPTLTAEGLAMSTVLLDMVYHYALHGVPKLKSVHWEPVGQTKELKYLEIHSPLNLKMTTNFDLSNNNFWKTLGFIENERGSAYIPRDEF